MKFSFHGGLNLLFLTDLMDIDEVFNIFERFFFNSICGKRNELEC